MSAGSLSSRIKWNDMVNMVFEIPDNENQNKLLKLLRKTYEQEQIIYSAYISALKNLYALGLRCFDNFFDPVKTKRVNLPAGWAPVQISKLLSNPPVSGFSPVESSEDTGRYVLNLNCLSIKGFAQTKPKPIIEENFLKGILVKGGDLLISRSNTQELVGLAGIYTASSYTGNTIFPDTMWRLDVKADLVRKDFLMYYLMSPYGRKSIQRIAAGTSGSMKKINKETLSGLLVPLPSISTQGQIVEAFRLAHSVIQNLEKKKSDLFTLRVAILER